MGEFGRRGCTVCETEYEGYCFYICVGNDVKRREGKRREGKRREGKEREGEREREREREREDVKRREAT